MLAKFEELPDTARVWIYQADRLLTEQEESLIRERAMEFCAQWAAHGTALYSSFKILHQKFLVLAAARISTK